MKNHRRPKMSDKRPTSVKPMAKPAVHEIPTQMMSGEGPIAALMRLSVFAGRTHPRYPEICAKQVAYELVSRCWTGLSCILTMTVPMKFKLVKYDFPKSAVWPPKASSAIWS